MKEANLRQPPQHLEAWEQNRWRLREQARVDTEMGAGGILLVLALFFAIPGAIWSLFGDEIGYALWHMVLWFG